MTGWLLTRGYLNEYYTIASIHEDNNYLVGLSYNPITKKYLLNLANTK